MENNPTTPTTKDLKAKKKATRRAMFPEEMGISGETYDSYVREHNKKLRRLQREQDGYNMTEPE